MALGNIRVVLTLDNGQLITQLVRSGKAVTTFANQVEQSTKSLERIEKAVAGFGASLHRAFVTIGLARAALSNLWAVTGSWGKTIIDTNAKLERMTYLMKGLSEASTDAGKTADGINQLNQVITLAKNAPFTVDALTDAWVKFRSVGLDPSTGSMQALVDAVAAFGGTDQTLHRASIAIQQMAGKGVISMEELRQQLGEAVPSAIVLLARGMNMTMGQLVKAISSGTVEAKTALGKLFAEFDRTFGGAAKQLMESYSGQIAKLKTNWILFQAEVGKGGNLFQTAKNLLIELNAALDPEKSRIFAQALGESLKTILDFLANTVKWIFAYRKELLDLAKAFGALYVGVKVVLPAMGLLLAAIKALNVAFGLNVIWRFARMFGPAAAAAASFTISIKAVTAAITAMFMANPVGFILGIVGALALGYKAWMKYGDSIKRATDNLRENRGVETQKDIDQAREALEALEKRLEGRKKELAAARFGFRPAEVVKEYERRVAETEQQISSLKKDIDQAEANRYKEKLNTQQQQLQASLQNRVNEIKFAYRQEDIEFEKKIRNSELTEKEQGERLKAFRDSLREKELEAITRMFKLNIQLQEEVYEKAKAAGDNPAIEKAIENIGLMEEAMVQYRLQASASNEALSLDNVFLQMNNGAGGQQANAGLEKLNSLKAKLAEVRAELQGLGGDVPKVLQEIANGKYDTIPAQTSLNAEQIKAAIVAYTAEVEKAEAALKNFKRVQKETADAFEALGRASGRAEEDLRLAEDALELGSVELANSRLRTFLRQMQGVRATTEFAAGALQQFDAEALRTAEQISRTAGIEKIMEMTSRNRELQLSLITNTKKRLEEEIRLEREALRQWIEINLQKTEEGRRTAEELMRLFEESVELRRVQEQSQTPFRQMLENWKDTTTRMSELTAQFTSDGIDAFVEFVKTGKLEWGSLVKQILADILKMQIRALVANLIGSVLGGIGGVGGSPGIFGAGGGRVPGTGPIFAANGGVVSSRGAMALNRYAAGGIANSPQVAVFGEGDTPEAYVPLPDGRSIPVSLQGKLTQQSSNVEVNVINQTQQDVTADQAQMRFDGSKYILDVVLKNVNQPGPFRDSMRAGLR